MNDRVAREKEAWNEGFDRSPLENMFKHSSGYWDDEVDRILLDVFKPYAHGRFLEIGSQTWHSWIHRLQTPHGQLDCINISETELENGRLDKSETNVEPHMHIMDAHKLEFEEGSMDVVFGKAILHHLDYEVALDEILRVLKPDGIMVFMEPLDFNPIMQIARHLTPSMRTPDEEPIRGKHWKYFTDRYDCDLYALQFYSAGVAPISRVLFKNPKNPLTRFAFEIDKILCKIPGIRLWFRSALIVGKKPKA